MNPIVGPITRRGLLKQGAAAAAAAAFSGVKVFGSSRARSLVYLYLIGGEDSNNLLVPLDGRLASYQRARGDLALNPDSLQRVTTHDNYQEYGFHGSLPSIAGLFRSGAAAVVANVGDAVAPDLVKGTHSYARLRFLPGGFAEPAWLGGGASQVGRSRRNPLTTVNAYTLNERVAVQGGTALHGGALNVKPVGGFPDTPLGRHLAAVASRLDSSGSSTEVFSVLQGGYDTHSHQVRAQAAAYGQLNDAVDAFYGFLTAKGLTQYVTLVTATEFNRTLQTNGKGGSDHGWGGQRLVIGGAAAGGIVHGAMPSYELGGADDVTGRGVWRPTMAESELDSALGGWAGYSVNALAAAGLPGISKLQNVVF
jgi:uncharacterized protein (DUF1501 family)